MWWQVMIGSTLFHAGLHTRTVFVWVANLLWLQFFAIPDLVVHLVALARCALPNASCPVGVLGEALVTRTLAALRIQARCGTILLTVAAVVIAIAGALALPCTCTQTLLVWALLGRSIRTVLVAQHLAHMLDVVVVLEALLAALLAHIFVSTSAVSSHARRHAQLNWRLVLIEFGVNLWLCICDLKLLKQSCIAFSLEPAYTRSDAALQVVAA
jgi:hypothetical protein